MITVFDLDGVLSRSDTMASVIFARLRVRPWLVAPVAVLALSAALLPADGRLRPRCNRAIVHIALAGLDLDGYLALTRTVAERLATRVGNLSPQMLSALRRADREGTGLVTTATERHLAAEYLRLLGVERIPLHASVFRFTATGPRFAQHNVGEEKASALKKVNPEATVDVLYTDSASDIPLARLSTRTVLVGPSPRSVRAFEQNGLAFSVEPWSPL